MEKRRENVVLLVDNRMSLSEAAKCAERHFQFLPQTFDFCFMNRVKIETLADYNALMTNKEFLNKFRFHNKILVIQNDSEMFRSGIEEFYDCDYIGAPWKFQKHGGNGGFSLRSVEAIMKTLEMFPYKGGAVHGYEDVYFSNHIERAGFKLATREQCTKFSCETIYAEGTLGAHAIDKYLTAEECAKLRNQYK